MIIEPIIDTFSSIAICLVILVVSDVIFLWVSNQDQSSEVPYLQKIHLYYIFDNVSLFLYHQYCKLVRISSIGVQTRKLSQCSIFGPAINIVVEYSRTFLILITFFWFIVLMLLHIRHYCLVYHCKTRFRGYVR